MEDKDIFGEEDFCFSTFFWKENIGFSLGAAGLRR